MSNTNTTNYNTCSTHEPEDYAHFKRMTTDRVPWDDIGPGMMLGKCRNCKSSISYPKGPSFSEPGPEFPTGLKSEMVSELELVAIKVRLWNQIPPKYQDLLAAYTRDHAYPGPVLAAYLGRNWAAYDQIAAHVQLSDEDADAIDAWLDFVAPLECFGDHVAVRDWLAAKPVSVASC